ncbi:hypothetical protein T01_11380 [Trichinella spiralis]|uniref:Uncharacterized protein n=1 Tax=Trichinella spiralis TaxID=6334 RepID=A0A0V1BSC1_TRISP|nr:hypothetical protein T01_11380 [Trichinella spiralis]
MKLAHISIAFNQLAGTGNSIAISCYKLYEMQKKLKVDFIEVGLTRKRRRIVNEKRHVQKRACESARMFCLY